VHDPVNYPTIIPTPLSANNVIQQGILFPEHQTIPTSSRSYVEHKVARRQAGRQAVDERLGKKIRRV